MRQLPLTLTAQVTFPRTLQLVKVQTGQVQVARVGGRVQSSQNQPEPVAVLRLESTCVAPSEEALKPFVSKALDRH